LYDLLYVTVIILLLVRAPAPFLPADYKKIKNMYSYYPIFYLKKRLTKSFRVVKEGNRFIFPSNEYSIIFSIADTILHKDQPVPAQILRVV